MQIKSSNSNKRSIDRRDFLKSLGCIIPAAAGSAVFFGNRGTGAVAGSNQSRSEVGSDANQSAGLTKSNRPNILFIGADDLNDWVGGFGGHPDAKTPNLDRMLTKGVKFELAQCAAPVCNPSRTALFTGLKPSTTGVYDNSHPFRFTEKGRDAVTLTQYLHNNGYYTCGSGKMNHGAFPDPFGWDDYFPGLLNQIPSQKNPKNRPVCGIPDLENVDWGPVDLEDEEMRDFKTVDYCIRQLEKEHDKPFFITCGIKLPHLPWYAPARYFELYDPNRISMPLIKEDDLDDIPEAGRKMAQSDLFRKIRESGKYREAVAAYLTCVTFADKQIGRLLDALEKSPYKDNTIIVFWGDHGWHLGEKHHWKKNTLWAEAARSPFFISVPGLTMRNAVCKRPVNLMDIYPTLVELCGLPEKKDLEGISLAPLLKNPDARWDRPSLCTRGKGNHAVVDERWRYIRYADGSEELYDHENDPNEWTNLASNPEYKTVKEKLAKWLPEHNADATEKISEKIYEEEMKKRALQMGVKIE